VTSRHNAITRIAKAYRALNERLRNDRFQRALLALMCFGFSWFSIYKGEDAHAVILLALIWLLMEQKK
jgi:hypothetical protein